MQPQQTPRIRIEDLPPIEQLTEEEAAAIFGAGPPKVRLGIEQLETRELMASSLMASLSGGVLHVEGTPGADRIRIIQNADRISIEGIPIQIGEARVQLVIRCGNDPIPHLVAIQSGVTNVASVSTSAIHRIEIATLAGADQVFVELGSQPLKVPLALTDGAAGDHFSDSVSHVAQTVSSDVVKLLRSADGTVFTLHQDNTIRINGMPSTEQPRWIAAPIAQATAVLTQAEEDPSNGAVKNDPQLENIALGRAVASAFEIGLTDLDDLTTLDGF